MLTPIILEGPGRSGSTLIMEILSQSEKIAFDRIYPYESRILTYIYYFCKSLFPRKTSPKSIKLQLESDIYEKQIIAPFNIKEEKRELTADELFIHIWKKMGSYFPKKCLFYAEKGELGLAKNLIISGLKETKLIYRIRDPRDVWISINKFDKKRGYFGFGRKEKESRSEYLRKFIEDQKVYLEEAVYILESNPKNTLLLKYEDIIQDYEETINNLASFINIDLPRRMPNKNFSRHTTSPSPEESIMKWINDMDNKTNKIFIKELGGLMEKLGYDTDKKPKSGRLFFIKR